MGWNSGGDLADELWDTIEHLLPKNKRTKIARQWVEILEGHDCDIMLETEVGEAAGINNDEDRGSYFPWRK